MRPIFQTQAASQFALFLKIERLINPIRPLPYCLKRDTLSILIKIHAFFLPLLRRFSAAPVLDRSFPSISNKKVVVAIINAENITSKLIEAVPDVAVAKVRNFEPLQNVRNSITQKNNIKETNSEDK